MQAHTSRYVFAIQSAAGLLFAPTLLLLAIAHGASRSVPKPPDPGAGRRLLAEGDRLADQGKYSQALIRYMTAYEKILPELRGLSFKRSVIPAFMERNHLRSHMEKISREDSSDQELALSDATLKVFGFVNDDFETGKVALDLQSEEVAGFYDPKRKQIFLIKEPGETEQPSLLGRLFGTPVSFDKDGQKMVLAHELAHALADQHFNLQKLDDAARDDDDRYLALQALVEGEATVVMVTDMMHRVVPIGGKTPPLSPATVDFGNMVMRAYAPAMSGEAFKSAPPIFQDTGLFGYLKGMVFVLNLTNGGGWDRVNRAFRQPPLSTEQILHPAKYLNNSDPPTAAVLPPELRILAGSDWKEVGQNVLGEFQISILLREHWGYVAAPGWDGDRYAVFSGSGGKLALVWFTTWDSETDAIEFAGAYARYLERKIKKTAAAPEVSGAFPPSVPDTYRLEHGDSRYVVLRRGSDVVIVEGFPEQITDSLESTVFATKKRPKG